MKKNVLSLNLGPWQIFLRTGIICSFLVVALFGLTLKRIEPTPLNQTPPVFDASSAHRFMTHLSKGFPNRVAWSESRQRAGEWLKAELQKMGYSPKSLYFSEVIAGKQYTNLEDIYVEKKGTTHPDEIILVMAHYDITDTTVEGAMDDASGVGVVLELARIFSKIQPDRTIIFLLTDSEEYGAFWGARAFAQNFDRAHQIVAAENFDFISPEHQTKILTLCDGLKTGYTPLWLREIALDSIRSLNQVEALDFTGIVEFAERAILVPPADHGPLLAAGIPAFNWVGQTDNFPHIMAHYHHTPHDVAEALRPESFDSYGKAAERVLRTLDQLPKIPENFRDSSYWKVSRNYYLPGLSILLIQFLTFIPFLAYSLSRFKRILAESTKGKIGKVFQDELKKVAVLFCSLLLGYVVMLLLPALHVITLYETFPATQKSLLLYTPNFLAIFLVASSIFIVYFLLKKLFVETKESDSTIEIRHAVHAAILTIVIIVAFIKNGYLTVLMLLPPAYFWMALNARKRTEDRILNGLLLLGGAVTFVAVAIIMGTIFHVGIFYWYIFLATAYGLISMYTVVVFFMVLTVMIRLFRSFVF